MYDIVNLEKITKSNIKSEEPEEYFVYSDESGTPNGCSDFMVIGGIWLNKKT